MQEVCRNSETNSVNFTFPAHLFGGFYMKISGIICEYNPLHNGHLYHLSQVREGGADGIVAVMSGNFVQRGDA